MYVYAHRQMPIVAGPPHDPLLRSLLALCSPFKVCLAEDILISIVCVYVYLYMYVCMYISVYV